ncbi:MAG TPA: cation-translocating P-type ATPase [Candidatus Kryptonia bacterium]
MIEVRRYIKVWGGLALMILALPLSWFGVWKLLLPVDFIALAATLIGGYPMFKEAFLSAAKKRMTMELSMSIAVVATLLVGQFFTALVVTSFVLFAELLEHMTVERGRNAISKLIELLPQKVTVRRNMEEKEINTAALTLQDIVIVKPGSRIPVDGVVAKGTSSVDQSSLTGESMPIDKTAGSEVLAGTINQVGVLEVNPRRIGKDTTFGKIIDIVEKAEKSKAPIQKVADKLAARLVYFAIGGAVVTFLVTHNIMFAISALVVAGACGVAAGTPLAILAGIGRFAKEGIITKGGIYLEELAKVDTIVVDKTGTLTLGTPQVTHIHEFDDISKNEILGLAACAEQHSEHPIANSILREAKQKGVEILKYSEVEYLPGEGVVCHVDDKLVLIGTSSLMEKFLVKNIRNIEKHIEETHKEGETSVFVAANGRLVGDFGVADILRNEASQAVDLLKKLDCRIILLSGDSAATTKAVGELLHVDESIGELLPHQKLDKIRTLKQKSRGVAMIGDGINDAPALVEANVGIAMGTGTDVAIESADMALTTNNLLKIVDAIKISRQCMRVIMFNFWGTIGVDTAGILLAFFGFLTPLLAALIHVGSEMAFILNSARLFRK